MTENQLKYLAYEESLRHNAATEEIGRTDATTRRMSADEDHRSNLAREEETIRSNLAKERETKRSNIARETETERSNRAREYETERSNRADEENTTRKLAEEARANRAREAEAERTNKANEGIKTWDNVIKAVDVGSKVVNRHYDNMTKMSDIFVPG